AYITKVVASGGFIRGIHAYGASIMVILLVMHMTQTFLFGAYKDRRELLWLSGCVLFALVLGMAFTGYLLPWDEKAYFATAVGTSAMSEVPVIGGWLNLVMRGGAGMGTLTISRFFVAHVFLIPGALLIFVALHLLLFRKAGPAGPPGIDLAGHQRKADTFYPKQALMDAAFALLLIAVLAVLAHFLPKGLGPRVNPADTSFIPRPEWYYRPIFQWLKYWEGPLAVIGILVVPGILAALLLGLPFYDRRQERRPWRRPIAAGTFSVVLLALIALGFISYRVDEANPTVAAQLARQERAEQDYMRQPFQPENIGGPAVPAITPVAASAATVNPLIAQGKQVFTSQGCVVCHGEGGAGTPIAIKLTGIGRNLTAEQLETLIRHPNAKMTAGGMPSFNALTGSQMKALIAYLESLK
ncbi:MAG: cytochrome b N-terminal domain-containing protein, partial [Terriglobia bacterium]